MNENAIPPKAPDPTQARQFLCCLDPDPAAKFSFRSFDDLAADKRLATKCHGTLDSGIRESGNPDGEAAKNAAHKERMRTRRAENKARRQATQAAP